MSPCFSVTTQMTLVILPYNGGNAPRTLGPHQLYDFCAAPIIGFAREDPALCVGRMAAGYAK